MKPAPPVTATANLSPAEVAPANPPPAEAAAANPTPPPVATLENPPPKEAAAATKPPPKPLEDRPEKLQSKPLGGAMPLPGRLFDCTVSRGFPLDIGNESWRPCSDCHNDLDLPRFGESDTLFTDKLLLEFSSDNA